ncbi:MAG: class I SAM-dependent methyltransferase [Anaerolinea sp.]|nr:class I SAM-dependent methyltransferase [Anaerolinea sp.]
MKLLRRLFRPAPQMLTSPEAYARWASAYPPYAHNPLMQAEEMAVRAMLPVMTGQTILDLACGTGRYSQIARAARAGQIIAIDNSPSMLRAGMAAGALDQPVLGDSAAIPLASASIDGVICALALGHLPALDPALREIARVLRPGGWAIISDVHPYLFLMGARRTFQTGGRTCAVEHTVHLSETYVRAGRSIGLRLVDLREPRLNGGKLPVTVVYRFHRE